MDYTHYVQGLVDYLFNHHEYLTEDNSLSDRQVQLPIINDSVENDEEVFIYICRSSSPAMDLLSQVCDMLKEFAEKNPFPALTVRCITTTETVLQVVLGMKTDYDYSLLMNCLEAFLDEELARRGIILYDSDACGDSDLDDVDDDEDLIGNSSASSGLQHALNAYWIDDEGGWV
jgi:hypothetical protein